MKSKLKKKMLFSYLLVLSFACVSVNGKVRGYFRCRPDDGEYSKELNNDGPVSTKDETTTTTTEGVSSTGYISTSVVTSPSDSTTIQADANACEDNGEGDNCTGLTDCFEIFQANCTASGIYTISPANCSTLPFEVYCNMTNLTVDDNDTECSGGGWTVFQRRVNGSVDFYRNWTSYKGGFGQPDHEFWLGNDKLHYLTENGSFYLRIDLVTGNGEQLYSCNGNFSISDENMKYKLHIGGNVGGMSGNKLMYLDGGNFSTFDEDNDDVDGNCASLRHSAWWFKKKTWNKWKNYWIWMYGPES